MPPSARPRVVLARPAFRRLLDDLRALLEAGKRRAEEAVGRELVRTYHLLGSRILAERLTDRAGYGNALLQQLADALVVDPRTLQQAIAFARLYPELPAHHEELRWGHYRELLRVKDPAARDFYEQQAAARGWSRFKLVEAIREGRASTGLEPSTKKKHKGPVLPRPREATYLYKAQVERVVDGDTLLLLIDLGFQVLKRQRVRLAAIDTPPLRQAGGKKAADAVREALASVDFVMIKTQKIDLYGRYVGHIFYAPGVEDKHQVFSKGRYLNAELVEKGLAQLV